MFCWRIKTRDWQQNKKSNNNKRKAGYGNASGSEKSSRDFSSNCESERMGQRSDVKDQCCKSGRTRQNQNQQRNHHYHQRQPSTIMKYFLNVKFLILFGLAREFRSVYNNIVCRYHNSIPILPPF
ncbi:hypothetical protein KQX54_001977 [Cotesia glomerata]|uniref:Uncharacterized protein n=1 Tax=Cotesia glomerata TaxID=32391 RepID=A0AAV7IP70_COTGL|nr:hypothetical protein KQX54_001977 [Cotesia glomerata]